MSNSLPPRLLIVDDEAAMRELLCELVESAGLRATAVADGAAMREQLALGDYALLLLDLRLKREDGLTLARAVRETSAIPIIILTGKGDETDRILGLELAADDYLMKPFNPRELVARIRALLRRSHAEREVVVPDPRPQQAVRFGHWTLDRETRTLRDAADQHFPLTASEYTLLDAFCRNAGRVLTRDALLELLRGEHTESFDRTIDVLILRLRRKIEKNPACPQFIRTERGAGYLFSLE